jgi:hypothetical protein
MLKTVAFLSSWHTNEVEIKKNEKITNTGLGAEVVEHLHSKSKALSPNPSIKKEPDLWYSNMVSILSWC